LDFLAGHTLLIDKPLGWTSFDVVKRVRGILTRRYGVKRFKVGHAGTLYPRPPGLLLVSTGGATKEIDTLQAGVKEYVATMALGATTPSFDLETEIDATYPTGHITRTLVEETLKRFTGSIEQIPPAFSAVKVDGKRAYKMARKGQTPDLKPKTLQIDELQLLDFKPEEITVRVLCSKGTYIRALARDIGLALGSGAHLTALRRTRVGKALIDDCMTVDNAIQWLRDVEIEFPDDQNQTKK